MDTYRSDEPVEYLVWFQCCSECNWVDESSYSERESAYKNQFCPECGNEGLDIESEYV